MDKTLLQEGIKSFFMAPDLAMISDNFLESSFLNGFESYFVYDSAGLDLRSKARILAQEFQDLLIFFTIDRTYPMGEWAKFLRTLQEEFSHARIGVLYKGIHQADVDERIKHIFLYELGITCGCIPMQFSPQRNHQLLLNVLAANEAAGRRRSIRMLCSDKHRVNLIVEHQKVYGTLVDVSLSHFSCHFDAPAPELELNQSVNQIQLIVGGVLFMVDGKVALKRVSNGRMLYVFVFRNRISHEGLEDAMKHKMNTLVCKHYQGAMGRHLEQRFSRARSETLSAIGLVT